MFVYKWYLCVQYGKHWCVVFVYTLWYVLVVVFVFVYVLCLCMCCVCVFLHMSYLCVRYGMQWCVVRGICVCVVVCTAVWCVVVVYESW